MGILGDFADKTNKGLYPENQNPMQENQKMMNQLYGYEMDEEKKNQMLLQFLAYLKESKERDRIKLQQSQIV